MAIPAGVTLPSTVSTLQCLTPASDPKRSKGFAGDVSNAEARVAWVGRINAAWRQSVAAIIETGKLLAAAKRALPPGDFGAMIKSDLLVGPRTVRMLMAVAADQRLRNHGSGLPSSWRTLYELTRLDDDAFAAAANTGTINAEMQRKDVAAFLNGRRDDTLAGRAFKWPADKYGVIYADPPWRYESGIGSPSRNIENHYPTMALDDICALPVADIAAADSLLYLWTPPPLLLQATEVIDAWGFTYRTSMVWVKHAIGMGYYARQRHELLLIAKRGSPPHPLPADRPDSVIEAPRGKHSAKPDAVYGILDRAYPGAPKIELFSRSPREGWAAWGNEAQPGAAE